MCSLTVGLMAAQMGMQVMQQRQQGKAQMAAYDAQMKAAAFNKAAEEHHAEKIAENAAEQQRARNEKLDVVRGQIAAAAGQAGLSGNVGSMADVLSASVAAHRRDTINALANQREDEWVSYVKQAQFQNEYNAANLMKQNTKKQMNFNTWATLIGGAASMYGQGYKEGLWGGTKNAAKKAASSSSSYNFGSMYFEDGNRGY